MRDCQPLVSVCIPVYNGEKYIAETIQSVLAQTYPRIEILIQDNASTDNTKSILKEFATQYSQIQVEQNEQNCGMTANWNLVINRARGDYVMLLSADDLLIESFVENCLATFSGRNIDAVTTNHLYLRDDSGLSKRKIILNGNIYRDYAHLILLLNPFSINFTLFTRETIERMRVKGKFFAVPYFTCDYDLWIRLALNDAQIAYLNTPLGIYRIHGENLSKQLKRMSRQTFLVLLANKEGLRTHCVSAYRFTLFRFIIRNLRNRIFKGISDRRMLYALLSELRR